MATSKEAQFQKDIITAMTAQGWCTGVMIADESHSSQTGSSAQPHNETAHTDLETVA